jgi:plasmid segregation protein ParM
MRLYVLGGGSCLIRNFGIYETDRVTINDDICATAKGYEYLAEVNCIRNGGCQ